MASLQTQARALGAPTRHGIQHRPEVAHAAPCWTPMRVKNAGTGAPSFLQAPPSWAFKTRDQGIYTQNGPSAAI